MNQTIIIVLVLAAIGYYIYFHTDLFKNKFKPMGVEELLAYSRKDDSGAWNVTCKTCKK